MIISSGPITWTKSLSNHLCLYASPALINTLRPRQDGLHFADDIFTCNFLNGNCCILIKFSLKYVRKGPIDNNPALVQIMAWRRPGDKPLSEPMMLVYWRIYASLCLNELKPCESSLCQRFQHYFFKRWSSHRLNISIKIGSHTCHSHLWLALAQCIFLPIHV